MGRPKKSSVVNPALEQKLKTPPALPLRPGEKIRRTNEEIEKEKLDKLITKEPNPLFIPLIKAPFEAWSFSIGNERLKLSDDEAQNLAQPLTQLVDYYLPKMPGIAYVWGALTLTAFAAIQPRLQIIKELKKKKAEIVLPLKCDKCEKEFKNIEDLNIHKNNEHPAA